MSFQDDINCDEEINLSQKFFKVVKSSNLKEIQKFCLDINIKPWEFIEEDDYTALHKSAFMDLSKPIEEMIRCFKERKDFNEHDLKNWINCKSKHGYTALLFASFRGNVSTIIQLIKHGADINLSNNEGLNVIHMASQGNQAASIVYFKEKYKIDIMSVDAYGSTPLHWACYTGSEQAFNFLISYKVDINLQDNQGLTPLHLAIVSERTRLIKKLLQHGAKKNIVDNKGKTSLELAVEKEKSLIAEMLNEKSIKFNFCQIKPSLEKVERNNINIIFFIGIHLFFECFVLFFILIPQFSTSLSYKIITFIYIKLFCLIILNHLYLIHSDPGFLKDSSKLSLLKLVEKNINIYDYCPQCIIPKTLLSKHCIICDVCVDHFDHHCYWINNCIGKNNINYFISFIIMITLNLIINIILAYLGKFNSNKGVFTQKDDIIFIKNGLIRKLFSYLLIMLGLSFLIPVSILLFFHLRNLYQEYKIKRDRDLLYSSFSNDNLNMNLIDKSLR